jgi:hypothetical protein
LSQSSSNKTSQNNVPAGDVAKGAKPGGKQSLKFYLEKKFNPMYNGKDAPSTRPNLDLPNLLQSQDHTNHIQQESNFCYGLSTFWPEANANNVLRDKVLAKATLKNGTALTMDANHP